MAYEKVGQELLFYLINISLFCQLRAQQVFMTLVGWVNIKRQQQKNWRKTMVRFFSVNVEQKSNIIRSWKWNSICQQVMLKQLEKHGQIENVRCFNSKSTKVESCLPNANPWKKSFSTEVNWTLNKFRFLLIENFIKKSFQQLLYNSLLVSFYSNFDGVSLTLNTAHNTLAKISSNRNVPTSIDDYSKFCWAKIFMTESA